MRAAVVGGVLFSVSCIGTLPAKAITVSSADLNAFNQVGESGPSVITSRTDSVIAKFSTLFPMLNGYQYADIGTAATIHYDQLDNTFKLNVSNNNENPWDFSLILNGVQYATTTIANGSSAILSATLLGSGTISSVAVRVAGILPLGDPNNPSETSYPDRNAEYSISAVPIPPALFLFGTGMIGLGMLAHRRKHRVKPRSISLS
jgi:hypothetical protein